MKIYVSGSFAEQARLRDEADKLWREGHMITGTWLQEVKQPPILQEDEWHKCLAIKDLAELASADCIILDVDGTSTTGGRYVEWGYALGRHNMLKLIVGTNLFGCFNLLADAQFKDWAEVRAYLANRFLKVS